MKSIYTRFLFTKHVLVAESESENAFEALYGLADKFSINIKKGKSLANLEHIRTAGEMLGINVPAPFYTGFPKSVRELSPDQLLFDQLYHYFHVFLLGDLDEAGHSIFEKKVEREVFHEGVAPKYFDILLESEARQVLTQSISDLCKSTRPLSESEYALVLEFAKDGNEVICGSKNLAVKLLIDTRELRFADTLMMSDVIKVVAEINYRVYNNKNMKKLNFRNADRKFVSALIDKLIAEGKVDTITCYEKKKIWSGLLHHIHYRNSDKYAKELLCAMRGRENCSVYSIFEYAMNVEKNPCFAAYTLQTVKGDGAVLRNLDYILSRENDEGNRKEILDMIPDKNGIVLLQLLQHYAGYDFSGKEREFKFNRFNTLVKHTETESETKKRKSLLSREVVASIKESVDAKIDSHYRNRISGKVFVAPEMNKIALPMQEANSSKGYGYKPAGSRIPLEKGKKVRVFCYWEKADILDLSCMGLSENGDLIEQFSWQTMNWKQSEAITFSGDECSGYNGGSEFYDIDVEKFKAKYPKVKYLVMCENVWSGNLKFSDIFCRAGYMTRELEDSGEIFEPKTVKTAFDITADSKQAYLFALDLDANEIVVLNVAEATNRILAADGNFGFLMQYFRSAEVMNLGRFASILARELVSTPSEADIIISDNEYDGCEDKEYVHSYDSQKVLAWMNM